VDRGGGGVGRGSGGGVGWGADRVAAHRPRPAEGGGRCGGRGGRRWPPGTGLPGAVDDQVEWCSSRRSGSGRSEHAHAVVEQRSKRGDRTREKHRSKSGVADAGTSA
jgi:hypothetical protein